MTAPPLPIAPTTAPPFGSPLALLMAAPPLSAALTALAGAAGLAPATCDRPAQLVVATIDIRPAVIVLDLSLSGRLGLRLVEALPAIAPRATVLAVVPFASTVPHALAAGAHGAWTADDLRALGQALRDVGSRRLVDPVTVVTTDAGETVVSARGA